MKELIAFILPVATAMAGMRLGRWVLGPKFEEQFGAGFRFAYGLAVGMLVFSQAILFGSLAGVGVSAFLAWLVIIWGGLEVILAMRKLPTFWKTLQFQKGHLWLLLLIPLFYGWWVFGRLSTLEGTMEFDANAFWVFRAKILYLEHGQNFIDTIRLPNLGYAHMDYPWLIGGLYALDYGAVGGVDEFVNKVWPFWMIVAFSVGFLSLAKIWKRPHPLAVAAVTIVFFLPNTLQYIRWEGGTTPMVFYQGMVALLLFKTICEKDSFGLAMAMPVIAGCAVTKFEGVIYGILWLGVLLPFCWKYKWFKNITVWKSAIAGLICLLPFEWYRQMKPVPYEFTHWWKAYTAWHMVLPCYLKALVLYIFGRFFNDNYFSWQPDAAGHLHWNGQWLGMASFVNEHNAVLPWLLVILLALSFWKKRAHWLALVSASFVMIALMAFLALILVCLGYTESDVPGTINYTNVFVDWNNDRDIGRYYYPLFTAWFLAIVMLWFPAEKPQPEPVPSPQESLKPPAPKAKRRR